MFLAYCTYAAFTLGKVCARLDSLERETARLEQTASTVFMEVGAVADKVTHDGETGACQQTGSEVAPPITVTEYLKSTKRKTSLHISPEEALQRLTAQDKRTPSSSKMKQLLEDEADQCASSSGGSLKIGQVPRVNSCPAPERRVKRTPSSSKMKQLLEDEADQCASSSRRSSMTNRPRSISSGAAFYAAAVSRAHQHNLRLRQAQQTSGAVKPAANLMRTASW